jgi:predicted ATPase
VALAEAVAHLTTALRVNEQLPASTERELQELDIRMLLGTAYLSWKGHAAPELLQAMEPARRLAIDHREDEKLVPILFYIWMHHTARVEFGPGLEIVGELDALSRAAADSYAEVVACNVQNMTYGWMGNFTRARAAAERGVRAYDPERHAPFVHVYNHDQKCGILSWAVHFLWILGYPDQAQQAAQEQVDLARRLGHPFNLAFSLTTGCAALVQRGEAALARQWIAEADAIGKESAISYVTHFFVPFWTGMLQVTQGEDEAGYAKLTSAWEYFEGGGGFLLGPLAGMMKATAAVNMGRFDQASRLLDEALILINRTDHRMHEAEAYRVLGKLQQRRSNPEVGASEKSYRKAIEVARSQSARGFELRAAMSLARLWQAQDRRNEARDLLAPIYTWFDEGLNTRDLVEARALLEELER